ncbi:MAG: hypothetical protein KAG14_01215 [Mycoplasmataceae bacterium]|nr:hypothetical protein [Mycoplasmataceae bacterium]
MTFKIKIYAIFQFLSFISLLTLGIGIGVLIYQGQIDHQTFTSKKLWTVGLERTMIFSRATATGILSSIFAYLGITLWLVTWIIGVLVLRDKERNLFDSIFLLFVMIPLLANLLALIAQLSSRVAEYTSSTIDKKEIKKETQIILINASKEKNKNANKLPK